MNTLLAPAPRTRTDLDDAGRSHTFLDELMARIGVDGLVAAYRYPVLTTAVDRHAAEVRESLATRGLDVNTASLAEYASLVLRGALGCRRLLPADPGAVDWIIAEWHLLRLVAVCALADETGAL